MRLSDTHIKWIMLVSGALTCTMIYAFIAPQAALTSTFGAALEGPVANVVVRNWGALITLVGAMLIYGGSIRTSEGSRRRRYREQGRVHRPRAGAGGPPPGLPGRHRHPDRWPLGRAVPLVPADHADAPLAKWPSGHFVSGRGAHDSGRLASLGACPKRNETAHFADVTEPRPSLPGGASRHRRGACDLRLAASRRVRYRAAHGGKTTLTRRTSRRSEPSGSPSC